jgi:hypothetical protein
MSLSVIGLGMPRTGTLSMKSALEQLGYGRCYHMEEVFAAPRRSKAWASFFSGGPVDWDEVFDGYGAAVDAPACFAWRALVQRYPEAKLVLTVRDPESWYASMAKTIFAEGYLESAVGSPIGAMIQAMLPVMMSLTGAPPGAPPAGPPPKAAAQAMQAAHDAAVKAAIPADRLLVFRVSEGWDPLCRFLGKPVPEGDFPRVNDAESFHTTFKVPTA